MKSIYSIYLLYFIAFIVNVICIKLTPITPLHRIEKRVPEQEEMSNDDNSYLIFIKTEDKQQAIDTIHNLIIENKNTFKDQEKFESIQINHEKNRDKYLMDYGYSGYVYEISHINGKSVLYAWLSFELVEKVKELPFVINASPNRKMHLC